MFKRYRRLRSSILFVAFFLMFLAGAVVKLLPYEESERDGRFYFPVAGLDPVRGVRNEPLWFVARDGTRLNALWLRPDVEAKATVLMLHGSGGNAGRYVGMARRLGEAGSQGAILDWRGFGLTRGRANHANVLADSRVALDALRARADVQGKPLLLWGLSMGGQVAIELARRDPDAVDALVTEGAVTSFRDLATDASPPVMAPVLWLVVKGPYEGRSAIARLGAMPKLIIQSRDDTDVPRARGLSLYAAATPPKQLWEVPGPHLGAMRAAPAEYVRRVDALLAQVKRPR